ncbi:MAG: response regulator [Actinobacteria bacterium]|nr:response regulator [Actinomycetota bacterium]
MRILIADDSLFVRSCLRRIVEEAGHEVVGEAENGQAAVDLYNETRPDVVTMDITMPGISGLEAVKTIKSRDPSARIVMVSAMELDPVIKEAIAYGAKGFIPKPFIPEKVLQELEAVTRFNEKKSVK